MPWFAIHTKPKSEKKVAESLSKKGYEIYLPLRKVIRQWSDRKKKVQEPLIKSYVFINCEIQNREMALLIPGVVRFLFWDGKPAEVRNSEIEAMRQFLGELDYMPDDKWELLKTGEVVSISDGILKNSRGEYLTKQGNKLLLNIESLGQMIRVEIPAQHVHFPKQPIIKK